MLWRDLTKEFDHDLRADRARCVTLFEKNGKLGMHDVQSIVDFFETIAALYEKNGIDRDLARSTWEYYFAGYFMASREALETAHGQGYYNDIMQLSKDWACEREVPDAEALKEFFVEERRCRDVRQEPDGHRGPGAAQ